MTGSLTCHHGASHPARYVRQRGASTSELMSFWLLSGFQVTGQVPIVILVWPYHDQLHRVRIGHAIGQKVLCGVDLELVDEYAAELATFLLPDPGVLDDFPDLLVENLFFLFPKPADPFFGSA